MCSYWTAMALVRCREHVGSVAHRKKIVKTLIVFRSYWMMISAVTWGLCGWPGRCRADTDRAQIALAGLGIRLVCQQALQKDANGCLNFAWFGMAPYRFFGEDQLSIDHDVKDTAAGRDEPPRCYVVLQLPLVQNFVRQTDGALGVVSGTAVLDADL